MTFDKEAKTIQWGEDSHFSKWAWKTRSPRAKGWTWTLTLHQAQKLTRMKDLNVRLKTIKVLEENIRAQLHDIGFGDDCLATTLETQGPKERTDQWDCISQRLCSRGTERPPKPRDGTLRASIRQGLNPKHTENSYNSTTANQEIWPKYRQRTWIDISPNKIHTPGKPISTRKDIPYH